MTEATNKPLAVGLDREAVARVIDPRAFTVDASEQIEYCKKHGLRGEKYFGTQFQDLRDEAYAKADAILALAAPAEGYVLVPVEPTEAMKRAGAEAYDQRPSQMSRVWSVMIAACLPAAPTGGRS